MAIQVSPPKESDMLDYTDPMQRPAIDVLVSILKNKVDTYNMHHAARLPKTGKIADPSIARMAAIPKSSHASSLLNMLDENLGTIVSDITAEVPEGEEHLYAAYSLKFQAIADHFKNIAKTWASEFANTPTSVVALPEGTEPLSLEDLQKLAQDCDDAFRLILTSVNQVKERLNDADAITDIESITGQSTVVRRSSKDDKVQYLLDIPRIRKARNESSHTSEETKMSLIVDGIPMDQDNFTRDCQYAFSLSGPQFLDMVRTQLNNELKFNSTFEFDHDGKVWNVEIHRD